MGIFDQELEDTTQEPSNVAVNSDNPNVEEEYLFNHTNDITAPAPMSKEEKKLAKQKAKEEKKLAKQKAKEEKRLAKQAKLEQNMSSFGQGDDLFATQDNPPYNPDYDYNYNYGYEDDNQPEPIQQPLEGMQGLDDYLDQEQQHYEQTYNDYESPATEVNQESLTTEVNQQPQQNLNSQPSQSSSPVSNYEIPGEQPVTQKHRAKPKPVKRVTNSTRPIDYSMPDIQPKPSLFQKFFPRKKQTTLPRCTAPFFRKEDIHEDTVPIIQVDELQLANTVSTLYPDEQPAIPEVSKESNLEPITNPLEDSLDLDFPDFPEEPEQEDFNSGDFMSEVANLNLDDSPLPDIEPEPTEPTDDPSIEDINLEDIQLEDLPEESQIDLSKESVDASQDLSNPPEEDIPLDDLNLDDLPLEDLPDEDQLEDIQLEPLPEDIEPLTGEPRVDLEKDNPLSPPPSLNIGNVDQPDQLNFGDEQTNNSATPTNVTFDMSSLEHIAESVK